MADIPSDQRATRSTIAVSPRAVEGCSFALFIFGNALIHTFMYDVKNVADDTIIEPAKLITKKLLTIERDFFSLVPNMIAALVFLLLAWLAGRILSLAIHRLAMNRGRPDLGHILSFIARGLVTLIAFLLAAAIVFPGFSVGTVFSTLGIGSVAAGFAFKDILQNLFSGLLILINRPFGPGDIVRIKDYEGIVVAIEPAVTVLKTLDGRKLLIPNSEVYTTSVIVATAYAQRRDVFHFWIDYSHAPEAAAQIFSSAIRGVEGVAEKPDVLVQVAVFSPVAIQMVAYWWADASGDRRVMTHDLVIAAIYCAAGANSICLHNPDVAVVPKPTSQASG